MSKRKILASVLSLAVSSSLLVGGTLAWQSINQTALNEVSGIVNPGGRLHDDFNGENKDVYVENFADEEIYVRVKLLEYLAFKGENGKENKLYENGENPQKDYPTTYYLYTPAADNILNTENAFRDYVDWDFAGKTVYIPTFNMNKDSHAADVNGTLAGPDGLYPGEVGDSDDAYKDYKTYDLSKGQSVELDEIWDADTNDVDELAAAGIDINSLISNSEDLSSKIPELDKLSKETLEAAVKFKDAQEHLATETPYASVMTMQEWIAEGMLEGDFWVYDKDGWAYYAKPIAPGEASGLLLDGISITRIDDDYDYNIYVVAQFVTAGDVGNTDGTGFYDENVYFGSVPTPEAEALLYKIRAMEHPAGTLDVVRNEGGNSYTVTLTDGMAPASFNVSQNNSPDTKFDEPETAENGSISATLTIGDGETSESLIVYVTDGTGNTVDTVISLKVDADAGA